MEIFNFRAWYKGDIEMGRPLKFVTKRIDGVLLFVMEEDNSFTYPFSTPFTDADDWITEEATGFNDKNGNPIYRGDIVLTNEGYWKAHVEYDCQECQYFCEDDKGGFSYDCNWEQFEIIGNIYEGEKKRL